MLETLRIRNFAVIEELELDFSPGLNVITGETGAGKSIVLKSMGLLLGAKASSDIIRTGSLKCEVQGLFRLDRNSWLRLKAIDDEISDALEEGEDEFSELIIRRTIESNGRGKAYCNGRLVPLGILAKMGAVLIDITGQNQQHFLRDAAEQRDLLDRFGVDADLKESVRASYDDYAAHVRRLQEAKRSTSERMEYFRRIRFECEELDTVSPRPDEFRLLSEELRLIQEMETMVKELENAESIFDDESGGIDKLLTRLKSAIGRFPEELEGVGGILEAVERASIELSEARFGIQGLSSRVDVDPDRADAIRERIDKLAAVRRKYGMDINDLISYWQKIKAELSDLDSGQLDVESIERQVKNALTRYSAESHKLTECRRDVGARLSGAVMRELEALEMKRCTFSVAFSNGEPARHGSDNLEFLLSPNPGESQKPLAKIASGGEMSRVLLVLKSLLNSRSCASVQVFDEVDSGTGGIVAHAIGERMRLIAKNAQVIVVTHSPQVAALGEHHIVLRKRTHKDRTASEVEVVRQQKRVEEIARMLAGKKVSGNFEQSAKELLAQ